MEESSLLSFVLEVVGYLFFFLWVILGSLLILSLLVFVISCMNRSMAISIRRAMKRAIDFITASEGRECIILMPNDSADCTVLEIASLNIPLSESSSAEAT